MKHIYIIQGWYNDIERWLVMGHYSSLKKAKASLEVRKNFYKANPNAGIKNPEEDIKIVKDILW